MKNRSAFLAHLKSLAEAKEDSITKCVAKEAFNCEESVETWFEDLPEYGCKSGMVPFLVYYDDTKAFFMKYYEEILEIKDAYEYELGEQMKLDYQLANHLAWFAFEYTASKIYTFYQAHSESLFFEIED